MNKTPTNLVDVQQHIQSKPFIKGCGNIREGNRTPTPVGNSLQNCCVCQLRRTAKQARNLACAFIVV